MMFSGRFAGSLVAVVLALVTHAAAADPLGKETYDQHCALCHSAGQPRTPTRDTLSTMEAAGIVRALETGVMRVIGNFNLTGPQRVAVAEYITGKTYDTSWRGAAANTCPTVVWPSAEPFTQPHWNGWGADLANTRYQSADMAKLDRDAVGKLELKWAFAFPGETFTESQPTVIDGRLFVGSASGAVYALDAKTGCTYWSFQADAPVKAPVTVAGIAPGNRLAVFFGDQSGRVYAIDAATGQQIWQAIADDHPSARITGGVQVFEGRVYVPVSSLEEGLAASPDYACCIFRGSVAAYDAATGKQIWQRHTIAEKPAEHGKNKRGKPNFGPSGASVWSAITIDTKLRRIYVGTGDNYSAPATDTSDGIMALALDTGERIWNYQGLAGDAWNIGCMTDEKHNCPQDEGPDQDMGASPILVTLAGGRRVLIGGQKSGVLHILDPDQNGKLLWKKKIAEGGVQGGIQWGPATDGKTVYVSISDTRWLSKEVVVAEVQLDPAHGGGLVALDLASGEILWQAPPVKCADRPRCSPAQGAGVTAIPGVVFTGSNTGIMQALDSSTGKVLWQYDTAREFKTVNGARGVGGAIEQAGAVVVDGMVYRTSGYSKWGAQPGNVLLAFGPATGTTK